MRGKAHFKQALLEHLGITPACAGKSTVVAVVVEDNKDHPRMCGEKDKAKEMGATTKGSPPRVRGKAWGRCCPDRLRWDHPRVCGEKGSSGITVTCSLGSPPRMRGKGPAGQILVVSVGITPACAGKSRSQPRLPCTGRDHPRACGEKRFASASLDAYWGSPPRMRGKDALPRPLPQKQGITPAYAGKREPHHCGS